MRIAVRPSRLVGCVQESHPAHHEVGLRGIGGIIMAQVSQVANWRPLPEKMDTFIGQLAKAKGIHERLGATINVAQTQVGGETMTVVYMMTFESGATYGAFIDALAQDTDWQTFWSDAMKSPSADLVSTGLYTAIEGL